EEWEAEEHRLALERPFLLLQEELDVVPDPTHRHTLQFRIGHVDIVDRIGEPHHVDRQERHQAHPPQQPEQAPPDGDATADDLSTSIHHVFPYETTQQCARHALKY